MPNNSPVCHHKFESLEESRSFFWRKLANTEHWSISGIGCSTTGSSFRICFKEVGIAGRWLRRGLGLSFSRKCSLEEGLSTTGCAMFSTKRSLILRGVKIWSKFIDYGVPEKASIPENFLCSSIYYQTNSLLLNDGHIYRSLHFILFSKLACSNFIGHLSCEKNQIHRNKWMFVFHLCVCLLSCDFFISKLEFNSNLFCSSSSCRRCMRHIWLVGKSVT